MLKMTPRRLLAALVAATGSIVLLRYLYLVGSSQPEPAVITIQDNLLLKVTTPEDLPPIPKSNIPPATHVPEITPLLIGFSQNWPMLQQAVVSYLVAGWPASDLYVVDNTGTMFSNRRRQLSIQNPSFLDYDRLEKIFQVTVITTPTLLSFSQLQNFFIHEALVRNWTHYFWSHMDVVALSTIDESSNAEYQSLYQRALLDYRAGMTSNEWAIRFYAYDRLALVSVAAFEAVGGWDTFLSYYPSDCDMYERLGMAGYRNTSPDIGQIFDVATALEDVTVLYRAGWPSSPLYDELYRNMTLIMKTKFKAERNTWQETQQGGHREPYFYDSLGRETSKKNIIALGRKLYKMKWGTKECRLYNSGVRMDDAWKRGRWVWST